MNAWEDPAFKKAVQETGRKRIVMVALFTEICDVFPVIDMMADGYQVMIVTDAMAGMSQQAHEMGIQRMMQAGAIPNTTVAMGTELFRDWHRQPYVDEIHKLLPVYLEQVKAFQH